MLVNVTGAVALPDGSYLTSAHIVFRRIGATVAYDGYTLLPDEFTTLTDGSGNVDFDCYPGVYDATASAERGNIRWRFNVPEDLGPSVAFEDCIDIATPVLTASQVAVAIAAKDEAVAAAAAVNGRATLGGTANAITLTSPSSLATGLKLRFRATSQNSGATTIALNGGAAIACRTITGVALPSGYIRTDLDTEATYDGTYWVLGREAENGSNANGDYTKFAGGTMIARLRATVSAQTISTSYNGGFRMGTAATWTFPVAFSAAPRGSVSVVNGTAFGAILGTVGATTADWYATAVTSQTAADRTVDLIAVGRWF